MTIKEIGELIKSRRKTMRLTQQQLAESIGANHKQYIPKIENGTTNITVVKLINICKVLEIKIELTHE